MVCAIAILEGFTLVIKNVGMKSAMLFCVGYLGVIMVCSVYCFFQRFELYRGEYETFGTNFF